MNETYILIGIFLCSVSWIAVIDSITSLSKKEEVIFGVLAVLIMVLGLVFCILGMVGGI